MPSHAEVRYAAYEPAQIFGLVADVESYPSFLPWCTGCRIYKREENVLHADLRVGFKMVSESFRSRVTLDPVERIDIVYLDGPFRYLNSCWKFSSRGRGLPDRFLDRFRVQIGTAAQDHGAALQRGGPPQCRRLRGPRGFSLRQRKPRRGRNPQKGRALGSEIDPAFDPLDGIVCGPVQSGQVCRGNRRENCIEGVAARIPNDLIVNSFLNII